MAKITEFTTPLGTSGNILNPKDWLRIILGVVVLIIGVAMGQGLARKISGTVPFVDGQIEPFTTAPAVQSRKQYL